MTSSARKLFVTTALPYANGNFHIGHIMEYIQADIWVRTQRLLGNAVNFVGADDTHGAPIMIAAEKAGKRIIIAAHGNSLRALVKYLDNMSEEDIIPLNIPTGVPLVYELDEELKPIKHYYLGDMEAIAAAQKAVANQGKAK